VLAVISLMVICKPSFRLIVTAPDQCIMEIILLTVTVVASNYIVTINRVS
jgi:hypothetical protein